MKVSINWLKELVNLQIPVGELIKLLPLRTIGLKEVTTDYIELDMKGYNRADLLSLRGVAYEVAAITNSSVKFTEEENYSWKNINLPQADVVVDNEELAPVYCIAKIENLKVEQSNETWKQKLYNCGIRAVNNVADITNLIMVEYGQPMHAFDMDKVSGSVRVRVAKKGEEITTLDGKIRDLTEEDLLIADDNKPIGIAGIMGGKDSEISNQTTSILLEAAIFDPKTLRKTATRLGLISEASKRFYHGLTKKRLFQALNTAIKMYESIGGKLTALTIIDSLNQQAVTINLTQSKIHSLIGIDISPDQVGEYLEKLHFKLEKNNQTWKVTPPYFRLDIGIEEDLIEEVARMYGYEKIPSKPLSPNTSTITPNPLFGLLERLKQTLFNLSLTEVQTYSYYSTNVLGALGSDEQKKNSLIKITNPISKENEYLRENNWPNLVEVVVKNIRQGVKDIAIFEIGKIYYRNEKEEAAEKYSLSIAAMNNTDNPLAQLYEVFNKLNKELNLGITEVETKTKLEFFHPNRSIQLAYGDKMIGGLAEVHKKVTDRLGIAQRVAVLEIGLTKLL